MPLCGELIDKVGAVKRDVGSSNYFRVWLGAATLCGIVYAVGFFWLLNDAAVLGQHNSWRIYFTREDEQPYPAFRIRGWSGSKDTITSIDCQTGTGDGMTSVPVPDRECKPYHEGGAAPPLAKCRAVAPTVMAKRDDNHHWPSRSTRRIDCILSVAFDNTTQPQPDDLALELEGAIDIGSNSYVSMWFRPHSVAWVLLTPVHVEFGGEPLVTYERRLHYHTSLDTAHQFHVAVVINSFFLRHFAAWDAYDTWHLLADFGGLLLFFYVWHQLVMCGVRNLGIENDSQALGGVRKNAGPSIVGGDVASPGGYGAT